MGTVVRSGTPMCNKMTHFIDSAQDLIIIELGAGDGAITAHILKKMSQDARLFVFEINPDLCQVLSKIKDHRMILVNDGAERMVKYMAEHDIHEVDMIISAIPFLVLPESLTKEILELSKGLLKKGGNFIQMHYISSIKKMYKSIFGNVHTYFVPLNIPPGYVFRCIKE